MIHAALDTSLGSALVVADGDRVLELCPIQVKLAGPSRRTQIAADK